MQRGAIAVARVGRVWVGAVEQRLPHAVHVARKRCGPQQPVARPARRARVRSAVVRDGPVAAVHHDVVAVIVVVAVHRPTAHPRHGAAQCAGRGAGPQAPAAAG